MWSASRGNHEERPIRGDPGVEAGEYVGLPINEAARQHADAWVPAMHSLPEWQARPHPITYSMRAPAPNMRIAPVIDPTTQQTIAYTLEGLFGRADRVIWLDGRPHPSKYAEHLWQGFSTGEFLPDGTLKVTTTHIKYSFVHRNGLPFSPYAIMTEYFVRHGDRMMLAIFVDDPIYLDEPLLRTSTFLLNPAAEPGRGTALRGGRGDSGAFSGPGSLEPPRLCRSTVRGDQPPTARVRARRGAHDVSRVCEDARADDQGHAAE